MVRAKSFGTHDGNFHADEVTACALLVSFGLIRRSLIFRTRDEKILKECDYVCDVGGILDFQKKRFDHHQNTYRGRQSSAGMVLQYLKEKQVISEGFYHYLNDTFVRGVDLHDIGKIEPVQGVATFSQIISSFLPVEYVAGDRDLDRTFQEALDFVLKYLQRLKRRFALMEKNRRLIRLKMQKKTNWLFLDKAFAWLEPFFLEGGENHPALFIVMPLKGEWKLRAIPPSLEKRMRMRQPLPKAWGGEEGRNFEKVSKIKGALFCHKGLFVAFFKTRAAVLKAVKIALKNQEKNDEKPV
ncbi:MAG: MYG1 family protein [Parachlamydiales bacterium]|jgi:uncharacterized UPF0160 family protein